MEPRRVRIGASEQRLGSDDGASRTRLGFGRRLVIFLGLVAGALVIGYTAIAVALYALLDPEEVAQWLEPRASAVLNRPVTFEGATLTLLPLPGLRLSGVHIDNAPGFDGRPPLAEVERVRFRVALLPLFRKRVNVREVALERPVLHLAVREDGVSNFGDLVPSGSSDSTGASGPPVTFGIEDLTVADGSVLFDDGEHARSAVLVGIRGSTRVDPDAGEGWRLHVGGDADSLVVAQDSLGTVLSAPAPTAELTVLADPSLRWITVEQGAIRVAGADLDLIGKADSLRSTRRPVDFTLKGDSIDLASLFAAVPEAARKDIADGAEGKLSVELRLRGDSGAGAHPRLRGEVRVTDFGLERAGDALARRISGVVSVGRDTIRADSVAGELVGGSFTLSGWLTRADRAFALRAVARPDLDLADRLDLLPHGTSVLSGDVALDIGVGGQLGVPEALAVDGFATLEGLQVKHDRLGVPVYVPRADVTLSGREASWTDVRVLLGEDPMTSTGRMRGFLASVLHLPDVDREIDATVHAVRLDLDAALPPDERESDLTYAQIAFANAGGRRIAGRTAEALATDQGYRRPATLPLDGVIDLEVDTLDYRLYRLDGFSGKLLLGSTLLGVTDASLGVWGGRVRGTVLIGLGEEVYQPFTVSLQADSVEARDFLAAMSPLGDAVGGMLSLRFAASGTTDPRLLPSPQDLTAKGTFTVYAGALQANPVTGSIADFLTAEEWNDPAFSELGATFGIRDGTMELSGGRLETDLGTLGLDGYVSLGGELELAAGLTIPPDRLASLSLRRTGVGATMLDRLRATNTPLDLGLRMGGTLSGPMVEPDALLATAGSTPSLSPREEGAQTAAEDAARRDAMLRERAARLLAGVRTEAGATR